MQVRERRAGTREVYLVSAKRSCKGNIFGCARSASNASHTTFIVIEEFLHVLWQYLGNQQKWVWQLKRVPRISSLHLDDVIYISEK